MNGRISAIIVAAGEGRRMVDSDHDLPKQFLEVEGHPLFVCAVMPFEEHPMVDDITVVLPSGRVEGWEKRLKRDFGIGKNLTVIPGGAHRRESVRLGMDAASSGEPWSEDTLIAVHDGARPLLTVNLLDRVINAAMESGAAVPALMVKDTVAEADYSGGWAAVADRTNLRLVQTPQVFRADWLDQAHRDLSGEDTSDDAQLVRTLGHTVTLIEGEVMNIKVTDPNDLEMVRYLAAGTRS